MLHNVQHSDAKGINNFRNPTWQIQSTYMLLMDYHQYPNIATNAWQMPLQTCQGIATL